MKLLSATLSTALLAFTSASDNTPDAKNLRTRSLQVPTGIEVNPGAEPVPCISVKTDGKKNKDFLTVRIITGNTQSVLDNTSIFKLRAEDGTALTIKTRNGKNQTPKCDLNPDYPDSVFCQFGDIADLPSGYQTLELSIGGATADVRVSEPGENCPPTTTSSTASTKAVRV